MKQHRQKSFQLIILFFMKTCSVAAALSLFSCTTTAPEPSLRNLRITNGNRFVAYRSPNRFLKPDTLYATWQFSGSDPGSLAIELHATDETTSLSITTGFTVENGSFELGWTPKNDSAHFSYFGDKTWVLSITAPGSGITLNSDTITITGPAPLVLDSPETPLRHPFEDTLYLTYRVNTDRISQIRTFYKNELTPEWTEFTTTPTNKTTNAPSPITEFELPFLPTETDTLITKHIDLPIRLLFKDYQSSLPGSSLETDDITLTE